MLKERREHRRHQMTSRHSACISVSKANVHDMRCTVASRLMSSSGMKATRSFMSSGSIAWVTARRETGVIASRSFRAAY